MQLIRRQNVIIQKVITTAATDSNFTANLKLGFIPDIVNIKLIVAHNDGTKTMLNSVYVSELNNYIGSFYDGSAVIPNICFDLVGVPLDSWNFILRDAAGALNTLFTGQIAIHMEFLKYNPKSL